MVSPDVKSAMKMAKRIAVWPRPENGRVFRLTMAGIFWIQLLMELIQWGSRPATLTCLRVRTR